MKYVVCYSGGHSSALAAVETVKRHGVENTILLNHDISPKVEHTDIKRFKDEVAAYLGLPIHYANMASWENLTPLKIAVMKKGFQYKPGQALCTYYLKTQPFYSWLSDNFPARDCVIVYGFDGGEQHRADRRESALAAMGYRTEFPLLPGDHVITDIETIGIKRPCTYATQKHANCAGCLKAGRQHWYWVYCQHPAIFEEAMAAEIYIGHSIIKGIYLDELLPLFQRMEDYGIAPQDIERPQTFWARVKRKMKEEYDQPEVRNYDL